MIKEKLKTCALQNTLLRKQEVKLQSEKKHLQTLLDETPIFNMHDNLY